MRGLFILYPYRPVLASYDMLLGQGSIVMNAYFVTVARVVVGTALNLVFTFPLAYVLSKRRLYGRVPITMFIFFTMLFHGGLIPNFVLVEKLGLLDSFWAMILPPLINPWWLLIMRNFMLAIPDELEEAAIMDGGQPPGGSRARLSPALDAGYRHNRPLVRGHALELLVRRRNLHQ